MDVWQYIVEKSKIQKEKQSNELIFLGEQFL